MSSSSSLFRGNQSPWHANQLESSAQMLERMISDALRTGETHEALEHAREAEQIVRHEMLETEDSVRLMLLAARLLDAASGAENDEYARKSALFVARITAFCESLPRAAVRFDAERFAVRVQLNLGNLERARTLANRIERRVTRLGGGAGQPAIEIQDPSDEGNVSAETWLLLAEVGLSEGAFESAEESLQKARAWWGGAAVNQDDAAMYELVSALCAVGRQSSQGVAALAHLYARHHVEGAGVLGVATLARIASAAGFMERVRGIGSLESERWRVYGPEERGVVESYLGSGSRVVVPDEVRDALGDSREVSALVRGIGGGEEESARGIALPAPAGGLYPLEFDLSTYLLASITSLFDNDRMTGPLVVDWSLCDEGMIGEAVREGAIFKAALSVKSGAIYFNDGSYVDAVLQTEDDELLALAPEDVLLELHRIGMARLPGSRGVHVEAGESALHVNLRINARPNSFNLDVMRRIDKMAAARRGDPVEEEEQGDEDFFGGLDALGATPAPAAAASIPAEVLDPLNRLYGADTLTELCQAAEAAIAEVCGVRVRVEVVAQSGGSPLAFSGDRREEMVWSTHGAGPLKLCVGFSAAVVEGREAARFVAESAARCVRLMPGSYHRGVPFDDPQFIAVDPRSLEMLEEVRIFARMDGTSEEKTRALRNILISGERGTGKEEVARLIHRLSGRADKRYERTDGGAINNPDQLVAELFGAKDGSYTGSRGDRKGLVQLAEGGTLFIDEIDEGVNVQSVLKRFAQFGTFKVIGDSSTSEADVRLIIATNRIGDGGALIKEDLRDRFWEIRVPPLRERKGDIRPLAEAFAREFKFVLPANVLGWFETLDWPGNVRQLRSVIERACSLAEQPERLTLGLFEESVERTGGGTVISMISDVPGFVPLRVGESLKERIADHEREYIIAALRASGNNKARASQVLGLKDRQGLYPLLKRLNISDEDVVTN
jgi:transcriptional regulator with AAA-type ATPase domain